MSGRPGRARMPVIARKRSPSARVTRVTLSTPAIGSRERSSFQLT